MSKQLIQDCTNAFAFLEAFYEETATLVREIEGHLASQKEEFIIGRPSGYGVSARGSTGLETQNVRRWMTRRFGVFFVERALTVEKAGQTHTPLKAGVRVLYLRFLLSGYDALAYNGEPITEPSVLFGVLGDFVEKKHKKFESVTSQLEYVETRVLGALPKVHSDDGYSSFQGELQKVRLFDLDGSEAAVTKVVEPLLKMYRS